jgi:hypothetical protein
MRVSAELTPCRSDDGFDELTSPGGEPICIFFSFLLTLAKTYRFPLFSRLRLEYLSFVVSRLLREERVISNVRMESL